MMKYRLTIAIAVLVGLGALAIAAMRSHEAVASIEPPKVTLPKLHNKGAVTELHVTVRKNPTISLVKHKDTWNMTAPLATKADAVLVKDMLDKLSGLDVVAIASEHKENHPRLEVTPDLGVHVVAKAGVEKVLDIYVGAERTGGTIVREEGSDTAVAVRDALRTLFDKEVKLYRNAAATDFPPADVTGVAIESARGKFKFVRTDQGWAQADGEKKIADFGGAEVENIVNTFARMRAMDFADLSTPPEQLGLDPPQATMIFTRKDGSTVELRAGKEFDNQTYFTVSGDPVVYRIIVSQGRMMQPNEQTFAAAKSIAMSPEAIEKAKAALTAKKSSAKVDSAKHGEGGGLPPEFIADMKRAMKKAEDEDAQRGKPAGPAPAPAH